MTTKNILITGAFGYIGSTFINEYFEKYNIFTLDTNYFGISDNLKSKTIKNLIKDIRDVSEADLKEVDIVVHMSELSNDPMGELQPNITKEINVYGTNQLISAANNSNISKFIYMSSCSVYGFNESFANENTGVNPLTEYAKSKVENEENLLNNHGKFEVKILRNATAFGFSPNHRLDLVVNDLVYSALKNSKIEVLSDGSPIRPIVHIKDICKIISHLIEEEEKGDVLFNVGGNNLNYSIKEIALAVSRITKINNVSFGQPSNDKRSYKVDFTLFENLFP
ncbi:SDR family oxidoreductase, partial [bacterium]|nr:SDR family oxidoreductase [bacterium]